jgi:hypothetical protein
VVDVASKRGRHRDRRAPADAIVDIAGTSFRSFYVDDPTAPPIEFIQAPSSWQTATRNRACCSNKVAVITASGPGGRELAVQYAREGAAVVIGAAPSRTSRRCTEEIDAAGGNIVAVTTDIADREHCNRIVAAAVGAFGGVDTVVQNAFAFRRSRSSRTPTSTPETVDERDALGRLACRRLRSRSQGARRRIARVRELDDHAQGAAVPGWLRRRRKRS